MPSLQLQPPLPRAPAVRPSASRPALAIPPLRRFVPALVALLLGLHAWLALDTASRHGVSFDEGLHLAAGYNLWLNRDHRIEAANGDLLRRWVTLPYLVSRPHFVPRDDLHWRAANGYDLGYRFLFELGNRPESLLMQARAMNLVFGLAAGLLVFCWSRRLFGAAGGLVSLTLFAFSPNLIAFGGIASTDLSITLLLFGATGCIARLLEAATPGRLAASLATFALLVVAKPSAAVILPVTALLVAARLRRSAPLPVTFGRRTWRVAGRWPQAGVFFLCVVLHAVAGWSAVWAQYDFRFAASPVPTDPTVVLPRVPNPDGTVPVLASALAWSERHRVLPEGFLRGTERLLANDDTVGSFLAGEWAKSGRLAFFPYAIWVKTPPAVFVLLALGAYAAWRLRRFRPEKPATTADAAGVPPGLAALLPHFALIGGYLAFALVEDLNIGHRHVLPIYPSLFVLAGASALLLRARVRWPRWIVAGSLVLLVADSTAARPHYLAYFAPQAGGPAAGYNHLVDSSLDWGMNLPALRTWLDRHDPQRRTPLHLAYFGSDRPRHYGIEARRLPGFLERRSVRPYALMPGHYAISASLLQGVHTAAFGPWSRNYEAAYQSAKAEMRQVESNHRRNAQAGRRSELVLTPAQLQRFKLYDHLRFARLCAWLRHHGRPIGHAGHGILIWRLAYDDLLAALEGPPVELAEPTYAIRNFP